LTNLTACRQPPNRHSYTSFPLSDLQKRRDDLQAQLHKIYRIAPHADGKAYGEAQDVLKNKEDLTFTDGEIDAFLPAPLALKAAELSSGQLTSH
jgi:hypothetical protein